MHPELSNKGVTMEDDEMEKLTRSQILYDLMKLIKGLVFYSELGSNGRAVSRK